MSGESESNLKQNVEHDVERVDGLAFEFDPQYSMNYIATPHRQITIEVFHERVFIDTANVSSVQFSIAELRFMADCAEKLQKARSGKVNNG